MPYTSVKDAKGRVRKIMSSIKDVKKDVEFTLYKYFSDKNHPEKIQRKRF